MANRKKYLVDKKLQLRVTFSLLGAVLLAGALIIASMTIGAAYNNEKIEDVLKVQRNIVEFLNNRISLMESGTYRETLADISANHSGNIASLNETIHNNRIILAAIIAFTFIQCVFIYFIGIRMTHRISGPVYVMTNYIKDIIAGREPADRQLRKKDEMKDFFSLLKEMVKVLKSR